MLDHDGMPVTTEWPAPVAAGPVRATVRIPGSKSWTNRALVLAAQATGPSLLSGALRSRDTDLMAAALRSLGVSIEPAGPSAVRVSPAPLTGPATVDCGLAGTVMRFVPPLAATGTGTIRFDGDPAARRRPMDVILSALRRLGVDIDGSSLPFAVRGTGAVPGGTVEIDASASSQFVSGLLLAAASFDGPLTVRHVGKAVPSQPHIEMTVAALRHVGVPVDDAWPDQWTVSPGPVTPWTAPIEPDLSNATPFLAAAALTGGAVTVPNWPASTTQAGDAIRTILLDMGASVVLDGSGLTVTGPTQLSGIDIDLHDVGELTPTVAALALFADGPSHLRGIGHLRGHETDRLAALAADIAAVGGDIIELVDGLTIRPAALHGGRWQSYADHRMATAGAIVGLRVADVVVDDIDTTAKTLPDFAGLWMTMLGHAGPDATGGQP